MLRHSTAAEVPAGKITGHNESNIIRYLFRRKAEKGLFGLEISCLKNAVNLCGKARTPEGKFQLAGIQRQEFLSLFVVEIRKPPDRFLFGPGKNGKTARFTFCHRLSP